MEFRMTEKAARDTARLILLLILLNACIWTPTFGLVLLTVLGGILGVATLAFLLAVASGGVGKS